MSVLRLVEDAFIHDLVQGDNVLPYYADWLRDNNLWTREHIYQKVIKYPRADWPRFLYGMWADDQGDFETGDMILVGYPVTTRYRELKTVSLKHFAKQQSEWVARYVEQECKDLLKLSMVSSVTLGFVSEMYEVEFSEWEQKGPALVSQYPIISVRLKDESLHFYGPLEFSGWSFRLYSKNCPQWFVKAFWEYGSPPHRKTRKEAEDWTSDVLIWWARKEAGLEDE